MGKASRKKRERRDQDPIETSGPQRTFPVFWSVIVLLAAAGVVALVLTAPDSSERERVEAASAAPSWADVKVDGAELSTWDPKADRDAAEGDTAPTLSGTTTKGMRTSITAGDGVARAYVVLAHWCPHCNAEVPRIVDWARDNELPDGVEVVAISTAADEGQPNFPPAEWLAAEDWPFKALVDDEVGTASEALGVEGYPFMVFVDRHGIVQRRYSGEMPIEDFADEVDALAGTKA